MEKIKKMTLPQLLEQLEKLAKAATPGPWFSGAWSGLCTDDHSHGRLVCNYKYSKTDYHPIISSGDENNPNCVVITTDEYGALTPYNSKFIAAANPKVIQALIAVIRELVGQRDDWATHAGFIGAHLDELIDHGNAELDRLVEETK